MNFVTAHDGFVLHDLVSYQRKHNEANGEENRDGADNNQSWNCGVEGPTEDPEILVLRARQKRNLLATLLLSQGVPMLVAGDEMGQPGSFGFHTSIPSIRGLCCTRVRVCTRARVRAHVHARW